MDFDHVYFDHNATSPPDPRVVEAVIPWWTTRHGNPSSVHARGREAHAAMQTARQQVAASLGASAPEIVFVATGTEANNAVMSSLFAEPSGRHLVTSSIEHPSIIEMAKVLETRGASVSWVDPDVNGRIDPVRFAAELRDETALACLMLANNEIGTLQPVAEVAELCRERGVPVLCDAVQAMGKVPVDVQELGVDYLTIAGHKFHGPMGAAALFIREGASFEALLLGGGQERRRRAATENVPAVVRVGSGL